MGGKSKAPPPPDYSAVSAASEKSAQLAYQASQEQLAWAREQYNSDKEVTDKVVNAGLASQAAQDAAAAKDRARYEQVYQPLEDSLVAESKEYASPERKDLEMGRAQAGVAQQTDLARQNAERQLEGFGINPASGKFIGQTLASGTAGAAAQAAAGTNASMNVDNTARALRSEALNIGKGYPGQISNAYAGAVNAGNMAGNQSNQGTATGASTMGTGVQWGGVGNQAVNTWGNTLNQGYQNQLGAYNANKSNSSGWGSALGLVGGIGLKAMGLAEGGDVPPEEEAGALPIGATPGGGVPAHASPSGGQAVDDVKASLTAGEFVFPKDVMEWKGEEWAQKEIAKARQAREGAAAKGEMKPELPGDPQFASRPQGALPV